MTSAKKHFGIFCAVLLVLTVTASAFFMAYGVLHDCSGENCAVCRDLALLRSAAGAFGALTVLCAVPTLSGALPAAFAGTRAPMRGPETPISQKVKLTR